MNLTAGHPLLLKLAASWLRDQPIATPNVSHILTQTNLNLLEQLIGSHRNEPEISVGKILAESVNRIDPRLKALWLNLSVYRLPFNLAAAQAMSREPVIEQDLRELVRRSLLEEPPRQGEWLFEFLPLTQTFANQQAGDQTEAHNQAIRYYQSIGNPSPENWKTLSDAIPFLEIFYHLCQLSQYAEAFKIARFCEDFLTRQGYNTTRINLYETLIQQWNQDETNQWEIGACFTSLGNAYNSLSQYQGAIAFHQQAWEIF